MPSEIQRFFSGQTIFLTGGTGFLGKIFIETLLRTCNDLNKIFVLVRSKKGKTPEERVKDIFDYEVFSLLKTERPDYKSKIHLIAGDCEQKNLGLSKSDRNILVQEVTCIIHAAANVKFDQHIRSAAYINVRAVSDLLVLAKEMVLLKVFLYISTFYSNSPRDEINEKFYDPPITANKLFGILDGLDDDELLTSITPQLLGKWPNTYTYTKAIAEDVIRIEGRGLPIAIIRPSIISSTYKTPMPGWIDNFYGPVGVATGSGLGVIRSFNADPDNVAEMVPVDYVVNCSLAVAWDIDNKRKLSSNGINDFKIPIIYNYVTSSNNFITWRECYVMTMKHARNYPSPKIVWFFCFALRKNAYWHKFCAFFLHTLIGYFVDLILICIGKRPIAVKGYARIDKLLNLSSYFLLKRFVSSSDNVQKLVQVLNTEDRKLFDFNMENINWDKYFHNWVVGIRVYLLKDSVDSIPQGRRKLYMLAVAHYTLLAIFWFLMYKLIMFAFGLVS